MEERTRWRLRRHNLRLQKDRDVYPALNHLGGYRIVDRVGNVVLGVNYALTLVQAEEFSDHLMRKSLRLPTSLPGFHDMVLKALFDTEINRRARQIVGKLNV